MNIKYNIRGMYVLLIAARIIWHKCVRIVAAQTKA